MDQITITNNSVQIPVRLIKLYEQYNQYNQYNGELSIYHAIPDTAVIIIMIRIVGRNGKTNIKDF